MACLLHSCSVPVHLLQPARALVREPEPSLRDSKVAPAECARQEPTLPLGGRRQLNSTLAQSEPLFVATHTYLTNNKCVLAPPDHGPLIQMFFLVHRQRLLALLLCLLKLTLVHQKDARHGEHPKCGEV